MIDFDDLEDAEDGGDDDQKATLLAAQKAWEEEKLAEARRRDDEKRQAEEAAAARLEEARARRRREEAERQRLAELRAKRQEGQQHEAQPQHSAPASQEKMSQDTSDLARGCPAEASSAKSPDRAAACAVDGNPHSRWTSTYADNQWLSVDLGKFYVLSRVEVRWEAACAESYLLQVSADGMDWDTLASAAGSEGWVITHMPPGSKGARWLRLYCQKRATSFGFSIWELKVYGRKSVAPAAKIEPARSPGGGSKEPAVAAVSPSGLTHASDRREGSTVEPERPRQRSVFLDHDASAAAILSAVGAPYKVLGLEPGASSADVRHAYHHLALKFHPDKSGDDEVFRAIATAYKALTEARDTEGGWRDMEGQAVGPWAAHESGANVVLFDTFGAPPWESRRLYTGCWGEAVVRCWELSKGEPGKVRPPPRLLGEINVGGFLNDLAAVSPHGLITAQSAGMLPQPGESLRVFNVNRTPFLRPKRGTAAAIEDGSEADVGTGAALALPRGADGSKGGSTIALRCEDDERREAEGVDREEASEKVFLHRRGCHALSLWPRPDFRDAAPALVGSASKDTLGASRVASNGCSLEVAWSAQDPHSADVNALCWACHGLLWSGGNDGVVRLWDVGGGRKEPVQTMTAGGGHVNRIEVWPDAGVMVTAHTAGVSYLDMRTSEVIKHQYTSKPVKALTCLRQGHPSLFMGMGNDLNQCDTRMFVGGFDKPKVVGQWTLRSQVISLTCTTSARGHLLVAVGCEDGKVAAFDTT